jgi:cytochrome b pre-mRNA-processing protein 3
MLQWISRHTRRRRNAHNLYGSIVAMTRAPSLYRELCVPDTLEGRFEMHTLHMFVFLDRLGNGGDDGASLRQTLVDQFFADMELTTRQTGVGDLAVPKKMRRLAAVFSDRLSAYQAAIADSDSRALPNLLAENVYAESEQGAKCAARLARYVRRLRTDLTFLSPANFEIGERAAHGPCGGFRR